MTNVEKFFEKVKTDKTLQQKLKSADENYKGDKTDREAAAKAILLPAAEAAGCAFTIDELREYEKSLAAKKDGAELSANELKSVAGGTFCLVYGEDADSPNEGVCFIAGESADETSCIVIGCG